MTLIRPLERPKMSTGNPYLTLNFSKMSTGDPKNTNKMAKTAAKQHNPLKSRDIDTTIKDKAL